MGEDGGREGGKIRSSVSLRLHKLLCIHNSSFKGRGGGGGGGGGEA